VGILTAHRNLKQQDLLLWKARGFEDADFYISKDGTRKGVPVMRFKLKAMKDYNIDYLIDDFDTGEIRIVANKDGLKVL
jgi:hypothetical protein